MQSSAFDPSYPVVCEYQKELELGSTTLNTIFEEPIVAVAESNRVQIRGRPQSNGPKIVHNNENWNFKKENFAIAHSPTESTQATGGYKVVNLLRNLIPKSLPTELSSFFKRVLEKKTFNHEDHYNTPGISSIIQNVRSNDSSHAIGTMSNNWTPWYFTREDE
ncbi:hypothetical protein Y032_0142g2291 [Ancylostoma ceylanicum]|uniref:Uncharacterized protein n=1 Tax=Ancylostoma ceylanicum TaxID=53326 RepID=A0A016T3M8_9BILA|nr:hypothetical protein Y032_0142g2291 [Ancylostoma ceylanicum]